MKTFCIGWLLLASLHRDLRALRGTAVMGFQTLAASGQGRLGWTNAGGGVLGVGFRGEQPAEVRKTRLALRVSCRSPLGPLIAVQT